MFKELFSNRLFIGALAFFVLCVGGSLLYMHHENQKGAEYAAETEDHVAEWNAKQNPTAEGKAGDTLQGGHVHEDGVSKPEVPHDAPVEVSAEVRTAPASDERFESDAEFKARMDKHRAEMAAAKTVREQNEAYMRQLKASPYFHIHEPVYNFLKEHPDFSNGHSTPELQQKYVDAVYEKVERGRAYAEKRNARHQQWLKNRETRPFIPDPWGNQ